MIYTTPKKQKYNPNHDVPEVTRIMLEILVGVMEEDEKGYREMSEFLEKEKLKIRSTNSNQPLRASIEERSWDMDSFADKLKIYKFEMNRIINKIPSFDGELHMDNP